MLQAIRERITGIVAIFVLGLLAVPFLFFGVESYIRAVPQDAVATVGDQEISTSEFQTSFARFRAEQRQQHGAAHDEIAINTPVVRRQHLEGMIDEVLLRQHAENMGLVISADMLIELIRQVPAFQINGQFQPDLYQQALRASGLTPRAFERDLREDLMMRMIPSSVASSSIVTEAEIDRMLSLQNETRRLSMIKVPSGLFTEELTVEAEDIQAYYEANLSDFLTTESVSVFYVELDTVALTADATLPEEELRQRYDAARQRFLTPELRQASHILLEVTSERDDAETEALAQTLFDRALQGESFAELAQAFSDDAGSAAAGGDLGFIEAGDMVSEFEDALFDLTLQGEISAPVRSPFGWHLIRLEQIREPEGMSFEEARDQILADFREREAEDLYIELSERLVDLVFADDSSLEPLVAELGLEIRQTETFTRAGGMGVAGDRQVIEAAFSDLVLLDRAVSDPIEVDRNRMVAIKLAEHFPAEPQPLEAVAEQIRDRLLERKGAEAARERALALRESVREQDLAMSELAETEGLEFFEQAAASRFDFQHGPDFISSLFRLPDPGAEPSLHVLRVSDGYAVVRLEAVQPGNPVLAQDIERQLMRQQILMGRINEEVEGLLAYLRANTRIRVVEDRI
ncbi:MAG: SurA N-terminal domain-containing protein [Wenzhouxiangella sp.]